MQYRFTFWGMSIRQSGSLLILFSQPVSKLTKPALPLARLQLLGTFEGFGPLLWYLFDTRHLEFHSIKTEHLEQLALILQTTVISNSNPKLHGKTYIPTCGSRGFPQQPIFGTLHH